MSIEARTVAMRWFSLGRTLTWIALVYPAWLFGWLESVSFVALLSLWALVETAFSAWRSDENPDVERIERIEEKLDELLAHSAPAGTTIYREWPA